MSKTPRTDDREFAAIDLKPSSRVVYASFARQLETELADARAEIERLDHQRRAGWTEIKRLKGEHEKSLGRAKNYILKLNAEIERKDKLIEQMREALLAARGTIEEGSDDLEADLLQPDKVIEQIDAVLQSITGGTP